jgi:hypothetical protein
MRTDVYQRITDQIVTELEQGVPLGIRETFNLLLGAEQTTRACRVLWRKEQEIGVAFP